jgi:ATP-dependent Clp protease ATP-binding subunit ClpA
VIDGRGEATPEGHIPFASNVKRALELSRREARELGHGFIGTEHLLLGLVRERKGVGAHILRRLGSPPEQVRQAVIDRMSEGALGISTGTSSETDPAGTDQGESSLHEPAITFGEREKIVLSLLLEGLSTRQIAETLGASTTKVEEIVRSIIEDLRQISDEEGAR